MPQPVPVQKKAPEHRPQPSAGEALLFVTTTCPNCRAVKPQLDRAGVSYRLVDVEENLDLARKYRLDSAPSLVIPGGEKACVYSGISAIRNFLHQK